MGTMPLNEATFRDFLRRVRAGEEITLTDQDRPVAHVSPVRQRDPEEIRQVIARWRQATKNWALGGLKIKDLITEGRM
jgi:antitoxin (DNA-binding transcriptional repressor) of toxin-antitoxin stability system